jgi:hypothetical protein
MFQTAHRRFHLSGKGWLSEKNSLPASFLALFLIFPFAFASTSAVAKSPVSCKFVSVSGKVTVTGQAGQPGRTAKKGKSVAKNESVVTSQDASAVLEFSDGSQLTLQPGTELSVVELKSSPDQGTVLKFKLALGSLLAEVARMLSVNSRFEIEAGGVTCGVRGTKFTMAYDPGRRKLALGVSEGSVYANSGKTRLVLNAGEQIEFLKGKPAGKASSAPAEGGNGSGKGKKSGLADPALKDLHGQFGAANKAYRNQAVNDPAAAGLKTKPNPNSAIGVIEAKP